jgi:hypothetical protein
MKYELVVVKSNLSFLESQKHVHLYLMSKRNYMMIIFFKFLSILNLE